MEGLLKTAILEISKLVDIECKILQLDMSRSRSEISELRQRLKLMELQPGTAQRQIHDEVRTSTEQKRECGHEDIRSPLCTEDVVLRYTPRVIDSDKAECKISMESQQQCDINQPIVMIKNEVHEVEITRWGSSEKGTQVPHCGEDKPTLSLSSIKDAEGKVPYVDEGRPENKTTKVPPREESLQAKKSISPGKMTVNQALRFSFSTCPRQTDTSSLSQPQSLNAPKSVRTCSEVVSIDKRFVCSYCLKRFRCFSQLEVHQRSHTGEKPYRCTLCGKRYAQKGHLYTHQRTHTGEKPYRCLLCGKGFIQKCTLDMHLRSHTGEKPFTCTKCGKGFTKKCNLNKHLSCQSCNS
ncbi:hypothetical protein E1301_Tti009776 [Triplophysa tibetana]|uniref:C2H2-type domain-containing protein n=1 Tax=Triplophysa tibetana TaxID=1572043 RepID=A0A5A9N8R7_9TELE|nr:hypothetical protein E1301_Tti009776 [Triplophysa tibetana]